MTIRRRTDPAAGDRALAAWALDPDAATRTILAPAVRHTLELVAEEQPGNSVELRVPPFGAVQAIAGVRHTRGTPPAIVETDAATWLSLAVGDLAWGDALASGSVSASGERSDLTDLLPLPGPRRVARRAREAHAAAGSSEPTDSGPSADGSTEGAR
ncbi:sterol carrier family protein [Brachybacterium halotolerans subsp. kimchii]|uniref:sterol carrier family protein n=1 Tax=Brachybacterium halotolerans TaxID=2795215 RepID=UPI001E54B9D4|nr:sterol carrier family protein [Brachybacterium halotolerans]UEJ82220.1 sterol carrier family protein [Brachybacterium halotolerans subsp. kimchii]